jgi:hypothetical protein
MNFLVLKINSLCPPKLYEFAEYPLALHCCARSLTSVAQFWKSGDNRTEMSNSMDKSFT